MTDRCPRCDSTDVCELGYVHGHKFTEDDKAQVCLDCDFRWGKP